MAKNQPKQPKPGIVLYLRVSSDDRQNPENSFEYQRQRIMDAINLGNNELPILNEYSDILSGTQLKTRPNRLAALPFGSGSPSTSQSTPALLPLKPAYMTSLPTMLTFQFSGWTQRKWRIDLTSTL
jgi:hypothetical protein